jgi:hypothetical protein
MIVSQARVDANRRNAQLSTGPRTEEGKNRSRANALKHGLCASAVVPEDPELIRRRSREFHEVMKPQNEVQVWMADHAALYSIRIDHCEKVERHVRDKISLRAELTWDDDRRSEAEVLGRLLAKNPAETFDALRRTPQGCDWLMARWALLAFTADTGKSWSEDQVRLAFDLLGTPAIFRAGQKPGALLDVEGRVVDPADDPAAMARREIAALKERREVVADLDEVDRALASSGFASELDPELRLLRRYESKLFGQLKWCLKQITTQPPDRSPAPSLRPNRPIENEPALKPLPKPADPIVAELRMPDLLGLPFDLEPENAPERRQIVNRPGTVHVHRQKKYRKAEARRESLRKELGKPRA